MMKKLLSIAVLAMMGGAAMAQTEVIYQTDFSNAEDNAQWTIINANNDQSAAGAERTWTIADGELKCDNFATSNDDYAFTPALNCAKGTLKLTYKAKGYSGRYSDSYEVVLTNEPSAAANFSQVLESVAQNGLTALYDEHTAEYNIAEAGTYYIGFHDNSTDPWAVYIDDVLVEMEEVATGISDIQTIGVKNVRYYNMAGMQSSKPFSGVNIVVTELNDGTTHTTKVVK